MLVSITVTALEPPPGTSKATAGESLAARARARHPAGRSGSPLVEEFTTQGGNCAVSVRRVVTQRLNGRNVTTGQVQALVAYPVPGALGIVSGVALDPDDLDRAAVLVTEIAAGMTVTSAPAAALRRASGRASHRRSRPPRARAPRRLRGRRPRA